METSLTPAQARTKFRKEIQAYFRTLVNDVRSADGSLPDVGKQIGVTGRCWNSMLPALCRKPMCS